VFRSEAVPAPVVDADVPDPTILFAARRYWMVATDTALGRLPVWSSTDLTHWTSHGSALAHRPEWAADERYWAPSLVAVGTRYWLFFAAPNRTSADHCVGRAVSSTPGGPFVPDPEPISCGPDGGTGTIDPAAFWYRGQLWLWMSDTRPNRLVAARVGPDGRLVGDAYQIVASSPVWIENPAPIVAPDGSLVLAASLGAWTSGRYETVVANCVGPVGPCGTPEPWLTSGSGRAGPGGLMSFAAADGSTMVVLHSWAARSVGYPAGRRAPSIAGVTWVHGRPELVRAWGA